MKINNRRYIGSKTKLVDFIFREINNFGYGKNNTFFDVFAGTGIVASHFADNGYKTILNDNLYCNTVAYEAFLGTEKIDYKKINSYLLKYNALNANLIDNNYFSNIYSDKYFCRNDAKIIGYVREDIENNKQNLNKREYCYLLTSLIYATDKIANTVGHFESFLNKTPEERGVHLDVLEISENIIPSQIYNLDSNVVAKQVKCDIAYIDPPYNARQYVNFYHVLENLARWNKPTEFEGNSMKFKRNELKSGYCRRTAAKKLFEDLINSLTCKLIVVSYNNTYDAKSTSSNNTLQPNEILEILSAKGRVSIKEQEYKFFNAGKTDLKGHRELLYICEVGVWN